MTSTKSKGNGRSPVPWHPRRVGEEKRLLVAVDHGPSVTVPVGSFAPLQRDGGWGPYAETFLSFNADAFSSLDVLPEVTSGSNGSVVKLLPGDHAGAIPLRSSLTGHVAGALIVKPRFGWSGVGRVLHHTGWHSAPEFLEMPLVPGSATEVPPWVLAGPVLKRLESLLRAMAPGYRQAHDVLLKPRGRIEWTEYLNQSLVRGVWHHVPCQFPDLSTDPLLRRHIRWALEHVHRDLIGVGGTDPVALGLAAFAIQLVDKYLADVNPLVPRREDIDRRIIGGHLTGEALRRGIDAIAWIVDERGLGGGNERDGLAWTLQLDKLWESYVESVYRKEVAETGGDVKVGRQGETVFPLLWSDPLHGTLGHLIPDMVIRRGRSVQIVDAKYKSHLVEVDDCGWHEFEENARESHRADLHQVLAYAAIFDADEITATLVYPLRIETFTSLRERRSDKSVAELFHGGRLVRLELRGLPFGQIAGDTEV